VSNNSSKILKIKSDKSELHLVNKFLSEIFVEHNLSQKIYNKVFLCISEAVINSIVHGNCNNNKNFVLIEIYCLTNTLHINIQDEGDGFNLYKVRDPVRAENVKKEAGRGIHIIKTLSNNMEYNDKGNRVHFKIRF